MKPTQTSTRIAKLLEKPSRDQNLSISVPVIRGWANYHKEICAKRTFARLGTFIYWQLKRWAKYQHGNKNRWWIYHRYFHDNHFTDQRSTKRV